MVYLSDNNIMTHKINLGSTLIALALFCLPWIDFQCSGKSVITQSGLQTIYGGGSISPEMEAMAKKSGGDSTSLSGQSKDGKDEIGAAPIIAISLLATLLAVVLAILAYRNPNRYPAYSVGLLSGVALLFIFIQMAIGFPMKKEIYESMGGEKPEPGDASFADAAGMMAMMNINVKYTNVFYLQLIALGIPVVALGMALLEKGKKEG